MGEAATSDFAPRGEHPFSQLYTWGVCCEPCTKIGMNWEERILRLHWMVHAVVHMQQFMNKCNVKYEPYGPWGPLPKWMLGTEPCSVGSDSSTSDADSECDPNCPFSSSLNSNSNTDSDSELSLTSCSPGPFVVLTQLLTR